MYGCVFCGKTLNVLKRKKDRSTLLLPLNFLYLIIMCARHVSGRRTR
jgi:hypothetical protein